MPLQNVTYELIKVVTQARYLCKSVANSKITQSEYLQIIEQGGNGEGLQVNHGDD